MSLRHRFGSLVTNHVRGTILFLSGLVVLAALRLVGRDEPAARWRDRRRRIYHENSGAADE